MQSPASYTLTTLLHEGTHTALHRGYRNADHARVIVKLLKSERPSARELARLQQEHLITCDLDAEEIVKTIGLERAGAGLALILEDFGGRALDGILRERRLELGAALSIAIGLAGAVGAAHDRHIIHRDIKPQSVLVNLATGQIKLTNFGIATRLSLSEETQEAASPDALEGTLAYMSPEQTGRMNRLIDHRSDLYSLGVTLYEMLTGTLPFSSVEPMELVHSHIARTPPPPIERAPRLPRVVSDIVMKLLSKAAEDRYQSAYGLKADLEECLSQWTAKGAIEPFGLGRRDAPTELRISQKLHGREEETAALLGAFERARAGDAVLVLVKGSAGVGKSALVIEAERAIAQQGGLFAAGRGDPLRPSAAYAAITAALRGLVRRLLSEPEESIARWREELRGAIGDSGQILVDLIPELGPLLGPQPALPELDPTAAQNRFHLLFQSFIGVFAARAHPLALFLDDLEGIDPSSLRLLSLLLTAPERGHILVVGAYSDDAVGPQHPLAQRLDELRGEGACVQEISLSSLPLPSVAALLVDTLGGDAASIEPLARLVLDKTQGNPLLIGQLLSALHKDGLLSSDKDRGAFRWDLARIEQVKVTDSVTALTADKIASLSPVTAHLLMLAACIGQRFDLETLGALREARASQVFAELREAIQRGLVLPQGEGQRVLAGVDLTPESGPPPSRGASFRFSHERVRQAAYARLGEEQRQEIHLRIGQLWRASAGGGPAGEERALAAVDQLNLGAPRLGDRAARLDLARQNLAAGRRAKAAAAHQTARSYFDAGVKLLDEASFEDDYALALALHLDLAECAYLCGDFNRTESLFDLLLSRAASNLDRARVYALMVALDIARVNYAAALRHGREGLSLVGVHLPASAEEQRAALAAEMAQVEVNLAGRKVAELIDAPDLTDLDVLFTLRFMTKVGVAAFVTCHPLHAPLHVLLQVKRVNLCLRHGRSEMSGFVFGSYGFTLSCALGKHREARAFWELARAFSASSGNHEFSGRTDFIIGCYAPFYERARSIPAIFRRAQARAFGAGDLIYARYGCDGAAMSMFGAGEELSAIRDEIARCLALLRRAGIEQPQASMMIIWQLVKSLEGRTRDRISLSDDEFDEDKALAAMEAAKLSLLLALYHFAKLQLLYLYGHHEAALERAHHSEDSVVSAPGYAFTTEVPFFAGLSITALYPSASPADKERYAGELAGYQGKLAAWAELCPENHRHKELLLAAEAARIQGRDAEARELYDEAIACAAQNEFTHHEALANELAGAFYLRRGQAKLARLYLQEARYGYVRWGATAKAAELAERYRALLDGATEEPRGPLRDVDITTNHEATDQLDAAAMIRAAQAIAGEIILDDLLDRLLRIVVENAGADRGVLLLVRDDQLLVEASMTIEPELVRVGISTPLHAFQDIAASVVEHVHRTTDVVVIGDATSVGPFAADPYVIARRPRSILCLSVLHQGRPIGVLYLENKAAPDVFTPARVELSGLLAAQAAIAVENARMVAELRRRTDALGEANARLARELVEREQAEAAREALKEELFRVQTPILPITERVMVMPLIGTIDAERASQVLSTALFGVKAHRAEVLILDVTGVEGFDAGVLGSLVGTTRALRLLGAQAVITGICPAFARRLVELGLDLGSIVTRGTLESGVAHAMELLAKKKRSTCSR